MGAVAAASMVLVLVYNKRQQRRRRRPSPPPQRSIRSTLHRPEPFPDASRRIVEGDAVEWLRSLKGGTLPPGTFVLTSLPDASEYDRPVAE